MGRGRGQSRGRYKDRYRGRGSFEFFKAYSIVFDLFLPKIEEKNKNIFYNIIIKSPNVDKR